MTAELTAAKLHLDTHVIVWLYVGLVERIPASAQQQINTCNLSISPMVQLELQYLYKIGRLKVESSEISHDLALRIGLQVSEVPFGDVTRIAMTQNWTRDPFDRLIAANAHRRGYTIAKCRQMHFRQRRTCVLDIIEVLMIQNI